MILHPQSTTIMFGAKANIYVSISNGYEYVQEEKRRYMRPRCIWLLSLEHQRHSLGSKRHEMLHYSASWDAREHRYRLHHVEATNFGIAGSITIAKNAHTSPEEVVRQLDENLDTSDASLSSQQSASEGSEHWIRAALYQLQEHSIVPTFDINDFLAFSQRYVARRLSSGSGVSEPAVITYLKGGKERPKSNGFWVSYPTASTYDHHDRIYGGLM